jgi:hypothetical protein
MLHSGETRSRPFVDEALTLRCAYQPFMVCFEDVFQPCLGALGVPLITIPDNIYVEQWLCIRLYGCLGHLDIIKYLSAI